MKEGERSSKRGGAFHKKKRKPLRTEGKSLSRSYLKTSAPDTTKKTASRKRGGAEFLEQIDLVSDLKSAFFPIPHFVHEEGTDRGA